MKIASRLLAAVTLGVASICMPDTASGADRQTTVGIESGYVSRNTSAYAGVYCVISSQTSSL